MSNTRLSIGGHEVWITAGGKELQHYGMELNETTANEISCWIPSETDQPFSVVWQKTTTESSACIRIYLDGHHCRTGILWDHMVNTPYPLSESIVSPTECHDFKFGSLEMTDDDAFLRSSDSAQNIGEIKVVVVDATIGEIQEAPVFPSIPEAKKVHETSKKGVPHQVKYGEKHLRQKQAFYKWVPKGNPRTFIFRYRPLALLQADEIAPRTTHIDHHTGPTKRKASQMEEPDGEEDFDDVVPDHHKIRKEKWARREGGGPERKAKEGPKVYFAPGEVIDLT